MDRATRGFYEASHALEGPVLREMFRRRIDFVTDPLVSPADLHEHLVNGPSDIDVRDTAALRPDLLTETMYFLVKQGITGDGPASIARNPRADRRTLSLIVGNSQTLSEVLILVVTHPNVDDVLLRRLSKIPGRPVVRKTAKDEVARRAAQG